MYYVKVATRSSRASVKASPRRAVAYITDNHDVNRDPGCSHAELRYIARMGEGWKTEHEGGRLPLVGIGTLEGIRDHEELVSRFEGTCQPWHDKRGTTGYKSFTFTLPKELSLHAEGHARDVKEAMYAAVREALARGFPGKDFGAVAAIHTRNDAGEVVVVGDVGDRSAR